jgi:hypothetical protein
MSPESSIEVAIETDDAELARGVIGLAEGSAPLVIEREGLDGALLQTILVVLTPLAIREVAKLVRNSIEARRHVRFIKDGTTIQGVSEATLLKLLEREAGKNPGP